MQTTFKAAKIIVLDLLSTSLMLQVMRNCTLGSCCYLDNHLLGFGLLLQLGLLGVSATALLLGFGQG